MFHTGVSAVSSAFSFWYRLTGNVLETGRQISVVINLYFLLLMPTESAKVPKKVLLK